MRCEIWNHSSLVGCSCVASKLSFEKTPFYGQYFRVRQRAKNKTLKQIFSSSRAPLPLDIVHVMIKPMQARKLRARMGGPWMLLVAVQAAKTGGSFDFGAPASCTDQTCFKDQTCCKAGSGWCFQQYSVPMSLQITISKVLHLPHSVTDRHRPNPHTIHGCCVHVCRRWIHLLRDNQRPEQHVLR